MEQLLKIMHIGADPTLKPHRNNIWHVDGYSYSTNGACLLRTPGKYGIPKGDAFPSVEIFDWSQLNGGTATLIDHLCLKRFALKHRCEECRADISEPIIGMCGQCYGSGEYECHECGSDVECDECDGTGKQVGVVPRSSCYRCHGTGVIPEPYPIGGRSFSTTLLLLLANNLPDLRFYKSSKPCKGAIGFRFGKDGMGALMSMRD